MARGWESKSVEAQQADAAEPSARFRKKLTPEEAAHARERETLRLSRQRVLEQLDRPQDPRRRSALEKALADLNEKLHASGAQ